MSAVPTNLSTVAPPHTNGLSPQMGGRKKNAWLAHVKATMKSYRNKSFKQVLKIAKKTYRNSKHNSKSLSKSLSKSKSQSQSQSQSSQNGGNKSKNQKGGSGVGGGKEGMVAFGENAAPVA